MTLFTLIVGVVVGYSLSYVIDNKKVKRWYLSIKEKFTKS